jgi:hypothetical protein
MPTKTSEPVLLVKTQVLVWFSVLGPLDVQVDVLAEQVTT